jgi:hypothetical protein
VCADLCVFCSHGQLIFLSVELSCFFLSLFVEVGLYSPLTKGKKPNRFRKNEIPFSVHGIRLVFGGEQPAADGAISSTRGACRPGLGKNLKSADWVPSIRLNRSTTQPLNDLTSLRCKDSTTYESRRRSPVHCLTAT